MNAVLSVSRLGPPPWETSDPFLFCVHHVDAYPAGNEAMGPAASLAGRRIGMDFEGIDGWRMYHGETVPGFPGHPHRGFETVTIVQRGLIDHADSLGAAARYGRGDVQWLTAGRGIVHAEMFPLLSRETPNPLELFQIWLNLPRAQKLAEPHFAMFWANDIPTLAQDGTAVRVVAGHIGDVRAPDPPPSSWAAHPDSDVAIWTIAMAKNATWTLPPASAKAVRALYFFRGESIRVADRAISEHSSIRVRPDVELTITNGDHPSELLLLSGRPIGEPVAAHGPFVMNTRSEIEQAFLDYRRTRFGGWPWPSDAPVHPRDAGRFAKHADGSMERAED